VLLLHKTKTFACFAMLLMLTSGCNFLSNKQPKPIDKAKLVGCYNALGLNGTLRIEVDQIFFDKELIYDSYKFGHFGRNPAPQIVASPGLFPYFENGTLIFRRNPYGTGETVTYLANGKPAGFEIVMAATGPGGVIERGGQFRFVRSDPDIFPSCD